MKYPPLIELQKKYPNLRKATLEIRYWSLESVKDGLQYFCDLNGRHPTALEIDAFDFLPSSRSMQRSFGGLVNLRKKLGLVDTHFGKEKHRSQISLRVGPRGRQMEIEIEKVLTDKFGEVFVHSEKFFNNTKSRLDFYIYCPNGNFGVDIFFPDNMATLKRNINIKERKYQNITFELYLVVANDLIEQSQLDQYVHTKKHILPAMTKIMTREEFIKAISIKSLYTNPSTKNL